MPHQDLPTSAPSSPRIKRAEKRMMTLGCAPAMIGGMLAFVSPSAVTVGFGLTLLVGLPILLHVIRLRRENQRQWSGTRAKALDEGLVLKIVELESGDHAYRLMSQAERDRERWGDDMDAWLANQADELDELDEGDQGA